LLKTHPWGRQTRRTVRLVASLLVVGVVFSFALPKIADVSHVWRAFGEMSPLGIGVLVLAAIWNIGACWLVLVASLPGSSLRQAMKVNLISTAVANTVPGGSAVGIGVTCRLYSSHGFKRAKVALSVVTSGVWNTFAKLSMPLVALVLLALTGRASAGLIVAAAIGILLLAVAVAGFGLALRSDAMARRIGDGLGRAASAARRLVRKPAVSSWGASIAEFRANAIDLLRARWHAVTAATVVSHLSLFAVRLLALRNVGIGEASISTIEALAAFSFVRLLSAIPITPGNVGVVELGLTGALVAAGGGRAEVVAAVLVYRALTYVLPIPLGVIGLVQRQRDIAARRALVPALADAA
jgi:putative heme transporter